MEKILLKGTADQGGSPLNEQHKTLIAASSLSMFCALQSTLALSLSLDPITNVYHEIIRKLWLYVLGTFMLFLLFFTFIMIVKHPLVKVSILAGCITLIALINYYEILLHGTVFTMQDIKNITTAMNQIGNYSVRLTSTAAKIIFSYAVLLLILAYAYARNVSLVIQRKVGIAVAFFLILLSFILFLTPFSPIRALEWSWEVIYYTDSFTVGTLENIRRSMQGFIRPEGYNTAEIENITGVPEKKKADNLTDNNNSPRSGSVLEYPDIILILDETYFNMDHLIDFNTDVPYMENYEALDAYKGYATVPMIGGGTNASEFELLTSNSMMLLNTTTPFNDLNLTDTKSIAEYLSKLGYSTMAAHTEPSGNYHRGEAWPALGFEVTHFDKDFSYLDYYGSRYSASDLSAFNNFKIFYEAMPEDQPRFAYLLTIQNHGGWDRNDPDMDIVHIQDNKGFGVYEQQINEYLTCIKQTDDFIDKIKDYFSEVDRDVVIIMVGDHGPALLKEWNLGEKNDLLKRQVPYFIWSNNTLDTDDLPENKDVDICVLVPLALRAAGLPLSPYYTQLVKLSEYTASLTGTIVSGEKNGGLVYFDKNGKPRDVYGESKEADLVKKYFYMEYNSLKKKGRIEKLFEP